MNYFEAMNSGLYRVTVPRMALYDPSAAHRYIKSTVLNNEGEIVTIEDEYIDAAINIFTMVEIDKKGYPILINRPTMIKEIVEIIYGHISKCIELKNQDILGKYPVPVEDLMDLEEFMVNIVSHNPSTLVEQFKDTMMSRMKNEGMHSMFEEDDNMLVEKNREADAFRRVTDVSFDDLNISDLLNTI